MTKCLLWRVCQARVIEKCQLCKGKNASNGENRLSWDPRGAGKRGRTELTPPLVTSWSLPSPHCENEITNKCYCSWWNKRGWDSSFISHSLNIPGSQRSSNTTHPLGCSNISALSWGPVWNCLWESLDQSLGFGEVRSPGFPGSAGVGGEFPAQCGLRHSGTAKLAGQHLRKTNPNELCYLPDWQLHFCFNI